MTVTLETIRATMDWLPPMPDPLVLVVHPVSRLTHTAFFDLFEPLNRGPLGGQLIPVKESPYCLDGYGWICNMKTGAVVTISLRLPTDPADMRAFMEAVVRCRNRSTIDGGGEDGHPE